MASLQSVALFWLLIGGFLPSCVVAVAGSSISSIPVLVYHQIDTDSLFSTTLALFTQQMNLLASSGYSTISPQQYADWVYGRNPNLPAKPILITFDDNIANADTISPVLAAKNFRAVMY